MNEFEKIHEFYFHHTPMYVALISSYKTLIMANQTLLDFAKVNLEDIVDTVYFELPWWQNSGDMLNKLIFAVEEAFMGVSTRFSATHLDDKGEMHEIDFQLKPITENGEIQYILAIGYNITELVSTRKSLTNREKEIKAFFENFNDGFLFLMLQDPIVPQNLTDEFIEEIIEKQSIKSVNKVVNEIFYGDCNNHIELFEYLGIDKIKRIELWKQMLTCGRSEFKADVNKRELEQEINLSVTLNRIVNEEGLFEGCFVIIRDTTKETEYVKQLSFLATKDTLTGLNNRRSLFEATKALYENSRLNNKKVYLAILDIDFFKLVNDTYGHDWGDNVLKSFAGLLTEIVPSYTLLARYGGEEFMVVAACSQKEFEDILENIRVKTEELKFDHPNGVFGITVSSGFCSARGALANIDEIIINADKALYESKRNGRNRVTMFIEEIHGREAYDTLCGVLKENSLMFRLNKIVTEGIIEKQDYFSVVNLRLKFLKPMDKECEDRYLSTLALCINKAIRNEDFVGRYGDNSFLAVFPLMLKKQVEEIVVKIIHNISIGFNLVVNNYVDIEVSVVDSKQDKLNMEILLKKIEDNRRILFI